jgi:hypothetical protein
VADMSLDELLSSSIKSAAEPAASAGVADAIRSRVAAGDAGTPVAGSTAPGWGGGASGILTIVVPIALIVVAGAVGGALGVTGVFGATGASAGGELPGYLTTSSVATGYVCPGGPVSGTIPAGTRVLAVARDDKGEYLGVRNPQDRSDVMFFATDDLVLDAGGVDPATLPVVECPVPTVEVVAPPVVEAPPEAPPVTPPSGGGTTPPPPPPSDTTPPAIGKISATPTLIINDQATQISVTASDNVAVTGVQLSWSIPGNNGSGSMTLSGGVWRFTYSDPDLADGFGNITFTARAVDGAGNLSAPAQVIVNRQYLG